MKFITEDYLLNTAWARKLYDYVKDLPIIDYHCHLSPREIYEDKHFENLSEVWLGGDHYKWRLMRAAGVPEALITGDGEPWEKFRAWAGTLEGAIGNPLLEWSHLELKNYFGFDGFLCEETAREVWELAQEKLITLSARELIRQSRVEVICTTDDPADDLKYHRLMAADQTMPCKVYPAWRPDKAVDIEKPAWQEYIELLSRAAEVQIDSFKTLKEALVKRLEFFHENACRLSDHGLAFVPWQPLSEEEAEDIFARRMAGESLSPQETEGYKFALLQFLGRQYSRLGWVMQLHYGVKRDNADRLFKSLGPDAGGDSIADGASVDKLANFLNALDATGELPKTILYSLNPGDNTAIETVMACFQQGPQRGKLQHGSAWWFNDNFGGMTEQLTSLAQQGYLKSFVGMLTDSRSFLSYARHEYFRRVLCRLLGQWVEEGRYPRHEAALKELAESICYRNAKEYFGFE